MQASMVALAVLVALVSSAELAAELATLVVVPPFKIAPAATVGLEEFPSAVEGKNALVLDARPSGFVEA